MVRDEEPPLLVLSDHDPAHHLDDKEYHSIHESQRRTLGALQRRARDSGLPVIFLFEGGYGAGIATLVKELNRSLDPRGFSYYPIFAPGPLAREHHFFWRFWIRTPEKGRIAIFDRGWYSRTILDRMDLRSGERVPEPLLSESHAFERTLTDSGVLLVKLYLHLSKKEQKQRLRKIRKDPLTMDHIDPDLDRYIRYRDYLTFIDDTLARTSPAFSPWHIIDADDRQYAVVNAFEILIRELGNSIERADRGIPDTAHQAPGRKSKKSFPGEPGDHEKVDLSLALGRQEYDERMADLGKELAECQVQLYREKIPLILLFEGWDAAGKGGNIMRVTRYLNPRGYTVYPVGPPGVREAAHHYLWRFMPALPERGHITIFDRSWYGRVLVERVESLITREEWQRAYREINDFERSLSNDGALLLKFWLHIDADEQLRRFREREQDPEKQWKITAEDWRNRAKWNEYEQVVSQMISCTSTEDAPWIVIPANDKYYSRVQTLQSIVDAIHKRTGDR